MMPGDTSDLSQYRVFIGDKMIGAICRHCGNQVLNGNEFCSWEHYEYWYLEESRRLFDKANR